MLIQQREEETQEPQGLDAASQSYGTDENPLQEAEGEVDTGRYDVEYDAEGNPLEAIEAAPVETEAVDETATQQTSAPTYWGPDSLAAPTTTEEDEQQFVSRAEMKRYAAQVAQEAARVAIQGYEASSAVTGYHLQSVTERAPEFMRDFGPEIRQALASVADPKVKAQKETTTAAVLTAVLRRANEKKMDAVDALLEAAALIQRTHAQPAAAQPREANVRAAVPSPGGGRGTANVASTVRARPSNNSLMGELFGFSEDESRNIRSAPEMHQRKGY